MAKTTNARPKTYTAVLVERALSFLKPNVAFQDKNATVNSAEPDEWFHLQPKHKPQVVPDWVRDTDTYKAAVRSRYITELQLTAPLDQAAPAHVGPAGIGNMQEEYFPPLAAETRGMSAKERTGVVA